MNGIFPCPVWEKPTMVVVAVQGAPPPCWIVLRISQIQSYIIAAFIHVNLYATKGKIHRVMEGISLGNGSVPVQGGQWIYKSLITSVSPTTPNK